MEEETLPPDTTEDPPPTKAEKNPQEKPQMSLPKKPRVPIYSSPQQLVALALRVQAALATAPALPSFGTALIDALEAAITVLQTRQVAQGNALMEYKQSVVQRDTTMEQVSNSLRILRDAIWAQHPMTPEIIADYGFDMFTSPASRPDGGDEEEFIPPTE